MSTIIVEEWRDLWSFKGDFLLACFALTYGTANAFRLPGLVAEFGAGFELGFRFFIFLRLEFCFHSFYEYTLLTY